MIKEIFKQHCFPHIISCRTYNNSIFSINLPTPKKCGHLSCPTRKQLLHPTQNGIFSSIKCTSSNSVSLSQSHNCFLASSTNFQVLPLCALPFIIRIFILLLHPFISHTIKKHFNYQVKKTISLLFFIEVKCKNLLSMYPDRKATCMVNVSVNTSDKLMIHI